MKKLAKNKKTKLMLSRKKKMLLELLLLSS